MEAKKKAAMAALLARFKDLDTDKSGFLNKDEVKTALKDGDVFEGIKMDLTDADIDKLIANVDKNNDNRVSYQEFVNLYPYTFSS